MKNNNGFVPFIILAIIAVLAIGGGAYYLGTKNNSVTKNSREGCIKVVGGVVGISNECTDVSQCEFYKQTNDSWKNDCYFGVATTKKDKSICNLISNNSMKQGCLNNIDISLSSENSLVEIFNNQPGAIKSVVVKGNNQWILTVDLLTKNPNFLPGETDFFTNQNLKIRNLTVTKDTKAYNCQNPKDYLLGNISSLMSNIQDVINKAKTDSGLIGTFGYTIYFDINGTSITAIYQQCLP